MTTARADCAPASDAPPFCLQATVTAGDYRAALVVPAGDKVAQSLHDGAMIAGWTLAEIGPRYIVVEHDERSVRLTLGDEPAPPPPVQTAGRRSPLPLALRNHARPDGDDADADAK
jgi:hypothetical protein